MSVDPLTDLASFQQFVAEQVRSGQSVSPEEALDLWRAQHPDSEVLTQSVAAIKEAIADMQSGDVGISLAEFDQEVLRRFGFSR